MARPKDCTECGGPLLTRRRDRTIGDPFVALCGGFAILGGVVATVSTATCSCRGSSTGLSTATAPGSG